jgi:oligopeptide transport system substrate-binding protein
MAKALAATTEEERANVYKQAETLLEKDAVVVPVYYYANTRLVKPYVGGITGKDPLDNLNVKNLYIIKH